MISGSVSELSRWGSKWSLWLSSLHIASVRNASFKSRRLKSVKFLKDKILASVLRTYGSLLLIFMCTIFSIFKRLLTNYSDVSVIVRNRLYSFQLSISQYTRVMRYNQMLNKNAFNN